MFISNVTLIMAGNKHASAAWLMKSCKSRLLAETAAKYHREG